MNLKQISALFVAAVAVSLVFLFPPYSIDGSLIGGTVYVFFRNPPSPDDLPSFDGWLVGWELSFILFSASAAFLALRSKASPLQGVILLVGLSSELLILSFSLPSFRRILVPELTWYFLTFVAFTLFCTILAFRVQKSLSQSGACLTL